MHVRSLLSPECLRTLHVCRYGRGCRSFVLVLLAFASWAHVIFPLNPVLFFFFCRLGVTHGWVAAASALCLYAFVCERVRTCLVS
jgi:hypothetical protein